MFLAVPNAVATHRSLSLIYQSAAHVISMLVYADYLARKGVPFREGHYIS